MLQRRQSYGMKKIWNKKNIEKVAILCKKRSEFQKRFQSAYHAAIRQNILDEICYHMPDYDMPGEGNPRFKWTYEKIQQKTNMCKTRTEFARRFSPAYSAARKTNILDKVCSHMPDHIDQRGKGNPNFKYTDAY